MEDLTQYSRCGDGACSAHGALQQFSGIRWCDCWAGRPYAGLRILVLFESRLVACMVWGPPQGNSRGYNGTWVQQRVSGDVGHPFVDLGRENIACARKSLVQIC